MAASDRRIPVCRVSVGGSPLEVADQARLVRARVELDSELLGETHLLFMDPDLAFINGTTFDSGKPVALKMGFGASAEDVFAGEVVRLEPQFRRDQPVSLLVIAQDSLHRLALKQNTRAFNDADASDVLSAVAQENGLSAAAPSGTKGHIMQNNLTDAEFLKRLAARMGLQLKLEDKKLSMSAPPAGDAIQLTLGDGVKKLKVKRKAQGQVASVTVHGWDEKNKQEVTGTAQPEGVTGKGAQDYGKGTLSDTSGDLLPIDVSSAEEMAKGKMKKIAEGFTLLSAEMIGDARLVPGAAIEFDKLGAGCDGKYRIERARHEFSKQGYFVKFDAVWTGPKDPPAVPPPVARAPYTPPKPAPTGKLTRPRWKRRSQGDKDTADLAVDGTKPLEGKSVKFILESKISGEWKQVGTADGTISKGVATANSPLEPLPASDVLSAPKWTETKDAKHTHGDTTAVSVKCKLPDPTEVRIVLEQQIIGGRVWEELDSQTVKTSGGEAKANFDVAHPHGEESGKAHKELLGNPVWTAKPGKEAKTSGRLSVDAPGLDDGRKVNLIVERLGADGKWAAIKTATAVVEKGAAEAVIDLTHPGSKKQPKAAKQLSNPTWEKGDLEHGDLGKISVDAPGLDGRQVRLVVERNDGGTWVAAGEKVVKVADGKAAAQIPLSHPGAAGGALTAPAWSKSDLTHGDATQIAIAAPGLDGSKVEVTLQRFENGAWVSAGVIQVDVAQGKVVADLDVAQPEKGQTMGKMGFRDAAKGKKLPSGFEPKRYRFRAVMLPDQSNQKLRFRAEPVPDLRPRRIRFRAELPVPQDANTRLTVKLTGGTDDDTVSTAASVSGN
ncbi:MAG TPA: contractile injection system protein, VgrG/Pvc8 family [Myxococcales bacterium]|nr:contractile injection system protein, VgrG/Pvc8 family [Myxococcales bacterium]